jgi:hypothetical protein
MHSDETPRDSSVVKAVGKDGRVLIVEVLGALSDLLLPGCRNGRVLR